MIKPVTNGRQLLLLLCAVALVGMLLGLALGGRLFSAAMSEKRSLSTRLEALQAELADKDQQVVNLDIADKVNRLTQEKLREKVSELQAELAGLQGELEVYKNLEDDGADVGLSLENLTLRPGQVPNSFNYQFVVRRKAALSHTIDATLALSIEGKMLGIPDTLTFNEADPALGGDALRLKFKYFKVVQGNFVLPEHFVAERIVLSLYETGRADSLVIREIPWRVDGF